jgi:hypothetical protein
LLADDAKRPRVEVSWTTASNEAVKLTGELSWRSPAARVSLGKNVLAYAALGGSRLDKGLGHPLGAIVRVGLYKADSARLFFEDIAEGSRVRIRVSGIAMDHAAFPRERTGLMHLKYSLSDLTSCGLDGNARNLFNSVDRDDPIGQTVQADSARWGVLDGKGEDHGMFIGRVEDDGSVTLECEFPYPLLRHIKDPYQRSKPGAFFEPNHFHLEMELLPAGTADEPFVSAPTPTAK